MRFTKMHGCGNDYIFVEESELIGYDLSEVARRISDRKLGVGSDGLIVLAHSEVADIRMIMFNADGSRGKMCGNGIRCLCKYAFERKLVIKSRLRVETDAGIKRVKLNCCGKEVLGAEVDMGEPIWDVKQIPVVASEENVVEQGYEVLGRAYNITCVSMGNPHAVIFVDDIRDYMVYEVGKALEKNEMFPEGVNVEFARIVNSNHIEMRVWERGSGETMACGTGACAVVAAAYKTGRVAQACEVKMLGGSVDVTYDLEENTIYLYGDANEVFQGVFNIK